MRGACLVGLLVGVGCTESSGVPSAPGEQELAGVRFTLPLPAGYRLEGERERRRSWVPEKGDGFRIRLRVADRPQVNDTSGWEVQSCEDFVGGGVSGVAKFIDGVERALSVGTGWCIEGTDLELLCNIEHTRGWIEVREKDSAIALCQALTLAL